MASKDTLSLDLAAALTGLEKVHIVQGGESVQVDVGEIAALAGASPSVFGAKWELAFSTTIAAATPTVEATGLGDYKELLIICRDLTTSVSTFRAIRFSTNNGTSYFAGAADYVRIANTGLVTNRDNAVAHLTNTNLARTIFAQVRPNIAGTPKFIVGPEFPLLFVGSLNPINAIQLRAGSGNLTGGQMFVLGLR